MTTGPTPEITKRIQGATAITHAYALVATTVTDATDTATHQAKVNQALEDVRNKPEYSDTLLRITTEYHHVIGMEGPVYTTQIHYALVGAPDPALPI